MHSLDAYIIVESEVNADVDRCLLFFRTWMSALC